MAPCKKVLMLCGDYMEDYEAAVPFYALAAFGVAVNCVAPGKKPPGDACLTAVHEFLGHDLYTELPGHRFAVTADFAAAAASRYDALVVPGGRFVERLSVDPLAVSLVAAFAGETATRRRPVVVTCHSQLLLAAAGAMRGVRCTAFFSVRRVVELAGGRWVEPDPLGLCVADGSVLSAIGWPAHGEIIRELLRAMGARVAGGRGQAVLFLCADYVDDYEANVPFGALAGVGCRVEAACPTKRKGEACVTAIYDATPAAASDERRGHNFAVTTDWGDVDADRYACVVVPGGRAPELLATRGEAVALVREFAGKGKVVASIDQGHLLLAAAGLLDGRSCASGVATRVVAGLAGAASVRYGGAVADGKLVTAASWPDLAEFIAHIISLLGITVSF
ncbi:DJ-1 protein homolog E-like [Oryza glaberrima]|uniref:DJ-1/PfpI domain-containing protein n=1 Tax=Oryza glaberrima TaxID=4538 RepID=I1R1B0_ORYGL|nr:DJ-1 protein homolog E-like [Oryza glaberrima]